MLPVATAVIPADESACTRNSVSVVFPFVPVTAKTRPRQARDAKSSSPRHRQPDAAAAASQGWSGRNPGEKTTSEWPDAAAAVNRTPVSS